MGIALDVILLRGLKKFKMQQRKIIQTNIENDKEEYDVKLLKYKDTGFNF